MYNYYYKRLNEERNIDKIKEDVIPDYRKHYLFNKNKSDEFNLFLSKNKIIEKIYLDLKGLMELLNLKESIIYTDYLTN